MSTLTDGGVSNLSYIKAVAVAGTAFGVVKESPGVLHSIIIGSNTGGAFRFWDTATKPSIGIAGSALFPASSSYAPQSYTPTASGSSVITFQKPIEFTNGLGMSSTVADSTLLIN